MPDQETIWVFHAFATWVSLAGEDVGEIRWDYQGRQEEPGSNPLNPAFCAGFSLLQDLIWATYTLFLSVHSFIRQVHSEEIQKGTGPFWTPGCVELFIDVIPFNKTGRIWGRTLFPRHQWGSWGSRRKIICRRWSMLVSKRWNRNSNPRYLIPNSTRSTTLHCSLSSARLSPNMSGV